MGWNIVIISGGQTGASRAALDFCLESDVAYGGWCPKGRLASDGPLDEKYLLKETPSAEYAERAEWNLRDSDAVVVFSLSEVPTPSSKQIMKLARKNKKPCIHFHRGILAVAEKLIAFVAKHQVQRLNIVGSSEDKEPGIYDWVLRTLRKTRETIAAQSRPFQYHPAFKK